MNFVRGKFFHIILCILVPILLFCNCSNLTNFKAQNVKPDEIDEYNVIAPPEDGWTDELINQVLYVDGKNFSMPVILSEIENNFIWSKEYEDEHYVNIDSLKKTVKSSFLISNSRYLAATLNEDDYLIQITGSTDFDDTKCIPVVLNGIEYNSTYEDVLNMLGMPNEELSSEYFIKYTFPNSHFCCICIKFIDNDIGNKVVDMIYVYNSKFYE